VAVEASISLSRLPHDSSLEVTPNRAMLGREVLLPASLIVAPPEENIPQSGYVQDFQDNLRQACQQVRQAMGSSAKAEKTYFDRRVKRYSFFVGQKVWLYWPRPFVRQKHRKLTCMDGDMGDNLVPVTDRRRA